MNPMFWILWPMVTLPILVARETIAIAYWLVCGILGLVNLLLGRLCGWLEGRQNRREYL